MLSNLSTAGWWCLYLFRARHDRWHLLVIAQSWNMKYKYCNEAPVSTFDDLMLLVIAVEAHTVQNMSARRHTKRRCHHAQIQIHSTQHVPKPQRVKVLLVEVIKGLLESTDGQTKMRHMRWDAEGAKALDQPAGTSPSQLFTMYLAILF